MTTSSGSRFLSWMFRNRETGRVTVIQVPNVPLAVFIVCRAVEWLLHPGANLGEILHWTGSAALAWWAVGELLRGVNPFRRMLGAVVLAAVLIGIAETLRNAAVLDRS